MINKDEILDALVSIDGKFKTKKDVVMAANDFLETPLSYSEWKHLWQASLDIDTAVNTLLINKTTKPDVLDELWNTQPYDEGYDDDVIQHTITGVTAREHIPDALETYQKMLKYYDKIDQLQERKLTQTISFTKGPICLVNIADIHFGGAVDIKQVFRDLEIINSTPGMYINFLGDLSNNFIGSWTRKINHNSPFTIEEEAAISKFYLQQASKRLIACCSGNHELWSAHESGIDILKTMLNEIGSSAIYDMYENVFTLDVMGMQKTVRTRHEWLGSSQYNDTHAIEKAAKFDQAVPFDIGVGGHTHRSGLYREFNNGGKTGVAILCGTYKKYDAFAREVGFPKANKSTAVCTIIDPDSDCGFFGISDIVAASKVMKALTK